MNYTKTNDSIFSAKTVDAPTPPMPILEYVERQLSEQNTRASELIDSIQGKLHLIADRNHPIDGRESSPILAPGDIQTALNNQVTYLINNNARLEAALSHLAQIV